jgi:hypothetical protein
MPRSSLIAHNPRVFGSPGALELPLEVATKYSARECWPAVQGLQVARRVRPWSMRCREKSIEEHPDCNLDLNGEEEEGGKNTGP